MKKRILILFFIVISTFSYSQSRLGLYFGGGTTWYYGDMNDRIFTNRKLFRTFLNGGVNYKISNHFEINANFMYGKIVGADSLAIQDYNLRRNLNFTSNIWEASLLLNYKVFNSARFNPYIIAGVGYFHHDPFTTYGDNDFYLHDLGTEGQYITNGDYPKPYKLYNVSAPLGIGLEYTLTRSFYLRLEFINHFTFTDYLDDLSGNYADSTKLAATPNGLLAAELASNLQRGYPAEGIGRGNKNQNDSYATLGVSLFYRFNNGSGGNSGTKNGGVIGKKKSKRKKHCPAFD